MEPSFGVAQLLIKQSRRQDVKQGHQEMTLKHHKSAP